MRMDRLNEMEEYILTQGTVSLDQLADHYHVSTNTIRRDIGELMERGHIYKVYGGVAARIGDGPLPMAIRSATNSDAKKQIGRMAAELVNDNDTVFLDSGSTILYMLPYLAKKSGITIVTHSLSAMYEASKYSSLQVIALGGLYNKSTSSYVGISTLDALSHISTDTVFIAATGVSIERGLTNTTYFEAEIKRKVVQCAGRVVLLADHSKFGVASTISFFRFEDLYAVVTDQKPSREYLDAMQNNNIKLIV